MARDDDDIAQQSAPTNDQLPRYSVDLGTGVLAMMRMNSGHAAVKPRLALRRPVESEHYSQGDEALHIMLKARHSNSLIRRNSDFNFKVPVAIDMMEDNQPNFMMSAVDEACARMHGYANPKDMRKSLGFKRNEDGLVFSYRLLDRQPDPDAAFITQIHSKATCAAFEAFHGAKGEKVILNQRKHTLRASTEPSIKRVRRFLHTLPPEIAREAEASIHSTSSITMTYNSEYGTRGQYTDLVHRPAPEAPVQQTSEERRAISLEKRFKRRGREVSVDAAFADGEIQGHEFLPRVRQIMPHKRTPPPTKAQRRQMELDDHLAGEQLPDGKFLSVEDYMNAPRGGRGR